jgi:hypothetical protein
MKESQELHPANDPPEWLNQFWGRLHYATSHFALVLEYARIRILPSKALPDHDREQVTGLMEMLFHGVTLLSAQSVEIEFLRLQRRCLRDCIFAHAGLALYDQDIEALQEFSKAVLGDAKQYPAMSKALVENHLKGWRDWRNANDPAAWIGKVARAVIEKEQREDDPDPSAIELDEAAETPNEAIATRCFTYQSIKELETAALSDNDLHQYVSLRAKGNRPGAIRRKLGWDERKTEQVRGQFRRLRDKLRQQGVGMGVRWSASLPVSQGSCTVYRELLFDGEKGKGKHSGGAIWQHRDPEGNEN